MSSPRPALAPAGSAVDLSRSDSSELVRGKPRWFEALWYFFGSPLVESRFLTNSALRCAILRMFGAKIGRGVVMRKAGVQVKFPWYLTIGDQCWIGAGVRFDNLAAVELEDNVAVSDEVLFCTGNHDYSDPGMRLSRAPIRMRHGSWAGARVLITPGVTFGEGAVAAAGSVITRDISAWEVHAGNPGKFAHHRNLISGISAILK